MVWTAIGDLLPSAIGVAISPVPVVAVILMLGTRRARSNGVAFAGGWVLGLTVVSALVLLLAGGADDGGDPSTVVDVVKLLFGLVLLVVAVGQWRHRPRPGAEPVLPGWMAAIDELGAGRSFGMGALLSGLNPKNLALTVAAAGSLAQAGLSTGGDVAALAVFVAVGSITVVGPVVAYLAFGSKVAAPLGEAKQLLAEHNAVIMAVVCLVLAGKLIGEAIAGLAT